MTFLGALAILFIGLKLGGVIAWGWLWVLAPLWGPLACVLIVLAFALAMTGLVALFPETSKRRRW